MFASIVKKRSGVHLNILKQTFLDKNMGRIRVKLKGHVMLTGT